MMKNTGFLVTVVHEHPMLVKMSKPYDYMNSKKKSVVIVFVKK
jgi:hypothetical protein